MPVRSGDLDPFYYPGDERPSGVLDRSMDGRTREAIARLAASIGAGFAGAPSQKQDCRFASRAWEARLREAGLAVEVQGGVGEDDETFPPEPIDRRSGYRAADGHFYLHYWLVVGSGGWLFDPTAHQFDDRGGVALDRYIVDGATPDRAAASAIRGG